MVRTRATQRVAIPVKGKRSGNRRARTNHSLAIPQVLRANPSRLKRIALTGATRTKGRTGLRRADGTRVVTAAHNASGTRGSGIQQAPRINTSRVGVDVAAHRARRDRRAAARHRRSTPTHFPRQGADRRKQSAYCLRRYKRN